jgi:hypothetical protein
MLGSKQRLTDLSRREWNSPKRFFDFLPMGTADRQFLLILPVSHAQDWHPLFFDLPPFPDFAGAMSLEMSLAKQITRIDSASLA